MFGEMAVCPDSLFVRAVFRESDFYLNSLDVTHSSHLHYFTPLRFYSTVLLLLLRRALPDKK